MPVLGHENEELRPRGALAMLFFLDSGLQAFDL
jgi:hypothetical protein